MNSPVRNFVENLFGSPNRPQTRNTTTAQQQQSATPSRASASSARPASSPNYFGTGGIPTRQTTSQPRPARPGPHRTSTSSNQPFRRSAYPTYHDPSTGPPPAGASSLASLPDVAVTEDDIKDEANSTCCICLDDYDIGERATRLPCGHLLHRECVSGWLKKHCTCPVCRYELRTDNAEFERGRNVRMAEQRPRYRLEALKGKKVHELRRLASAVGVDVRGCLEKQDLVDALVHSQRIQIISDNLSESSPSPPVSSSSIPSPSRAAAEASPSPSSSLDEYSISDLESMGVGALRRLMLSLGGPAKGMDPKKCIEKSDMVKLIVKSGCIKVKVEKETLTLERLGELGIADLKEMMRRLSIDIPQQCIERSELVKVLFDSGKVSISTDPTSGPSSSQEQEVPGSGGGGRGGGGGGDQDTQGNEEVPASGGGGDQDTHGYEQQPMPGAPMGKEDVSEQSPIGNTTPSADLEWTCTVCTLLNSNSVMICMVCESPR